LSISIAQKQPVSEEKGKDVHVKVNVGGSDQPKPKKEAKKSEKKGAKKVDRATKQERE